MSEVDVRVAVSRHSPRWPNLIGQSLVRASRHSGRNINWGIGNLSVSRTWHFSVSDFRLLSLLSLPFAASHRESVGQFVILIPQTNKHQQVGVRLPWIEELIR